MKNLLFFLLILSGVTTQAKNYYVSTSGNNANSGLTPATAWQTIDKVNASFSLFAGGDSILFKCGEVFYGSVNVTKSGTSASPIVFGSYGTGSKPVITGFKTITGWVNLGGNIWEAPTTNVKAGNNLVVRNGVIQQVGRYPNRDAAKGGYLSNTAATSTSLTGPALSTTTNWTGAEVAFRSNRWTIDRQIVTSHSGGTINFASNPTKPLVGFGYFFQRDPRTLDQDGEWYQNGSTNKLRMYFSNNNPSAYTIQAASIDTLFKGQKSNITVSNIKFTGAAKAGAVLNGSSGITFKNCDAYLVGEEGLSTWFCTNITFDNCTSDYSLGSGISARSTNSGEVNIVVKNCTVTNTSLIPGMETSHLANTNNGILVRGGSKIQVLNNVVKNSGYIGIEWYGDNVSIKYNLVDGFCSARDDGSGIYTWEAVTGSTLPTRVNRNIVSNIVINGIGAPNGTDADEFETAVNGIYLDDGTRSVVVDSNTIANIPGNGIHGNSNSINTFTNNRIYNTQYSISLQRFDGSPLVRSMVIKKNVFYPYKFRYRNLGLDKPSLITKEADLLALGALDSNYYAVTKGVDTSIVTVTTYGDKSNYKGVNYGFSYLTGTVGIEKHSVKIENTGKLEYNASSSPKVVSFSGQSKKDEYGIIHQNSITIPAWSSRVLIPYQTTTVNQAPIAKAGSDNTITLPVNTVTLNGSATDDGTISSYAWTKLAGPASGVIVSPNAATTAVNSLVQGVYQFVLTVTDNNGDTGKDTMKVTVNAAANKAPVAKAGSDNKITLPVNTVTLSGTATDDGTISIYAWTKLAGPSSYVIASPNASTTAVNSLVQGVYQFVLTVTDNNGATGKDTMKVTVNAAPNQAPVAKAGADIVITLPTNTTTLSGSGTDADGTVASYSWVKISGQAGVTIETPATANPTISNLQAGNYQFELVVTDDKGLVGRDTVQVSVMEAIIYKPTANAGADIEINSPQNGTTLNGSATSPSGTITSYKWSKVSGPESGKIGLADSATTIVKKLVAGVYEFQLTVTDNIGQVATDTVRVTVKSYHRNAPLSIKTSKRPIDSTASMVEDTVQVTVKAKSVANDHFSTGRSKQLKVYPNPVVDIANLDLPDAGNQQLAVSVTDMNGRQVRFQGHVNLNHSKAYKLDMRGLQQGFYIIQVTFPDGYKLSAKVVKTGQ